MSMSKNPVVNAMLICDKVIAEVGTNKKSLIGVFEDIRSKAFPCKHNFLSVYIKLTDAQGNYKFSLKLVDLNDNSTIAIAETSNEITISSPLAFHELIFNFAGLCFKHPGTYEFQLSSNDAVIGHKTFSIHQISKEPAGNN